MNYNKELDAILNDATENTFQVKVVSLLEDLREEVANSHERFWTKEIKGSPNPKDIFGLSKPLDALKAISLDPTMTIADRLVITIMYNSEKVTTDELLQLTGMSVGGLRRIVNKLVEQSYIIKIKNGLYKAYDKQVY